LFQKSLILLFENDPSAILERKQFDEDNISYSWMSRGDPLQRLT